MRRAILITIIAIINLTFLHSVNAEVKLPAIVSSNMVLQRNTTVNLWGWASPNEKITITATWLNKPLKIQADIEGNWSVMVQTTNSKNPQIVEIKSKKSKITLDNILLGEVWLCSGQSNMQMPMKGFNGQPVYESNMAIMKSKNPNLRLFTVGLVASKTPNKDLGKFTSWQEASPESVSKFSAVAYLFGSQLQEILEVPVGLIHTSWGGSSVQAWMSKEALSEYRTVNLDDVDISNKPNQIPTVLFNGMINPIVQYTIKGAIWYQGESNVWEHKLYKKIFPSMVKDWRTRWDNGDFPFYYVQITPFSYVSPKEDKFIQLSAFLRESQLQSLDLIPNSGIAITMDIGAQNSIHPPKKKEVADRLLFNALNQTYGYKSIKYASPTFDSLKVINNKILLTFKNAETGLYAFNTLKGFEIAGEDRIFYPANAIIVDKKNVSVNSEKVPNPVAVRYAWSNWIIGTLFGNNLLPASSFRTDNWENAKRIENQ
ncbi:MAG: sialate O-acetylesterase [Lutibacter sp.]